MKYLGDLKKGIEVRDTYIALAKEDEKAAEELKFKGMYRHAMYFYIQAMEKHIRAKIFSLVNPKNEYFRDRNRDHSLDKAIEFLLEIITTNDVLRKQISEQIEKYVLKDIKYQQLHNNLRYPYYNRKADDYCCISYSADDCWRIEENLDSLKNYLVQLERV